MRYLERYQFNLAISAIVWHELLVGCYRLSHSKKKTAIERYLAEIALPILPYDQDAAAWHAAERARLIGMGKTPPFIDGQIAAIACTRNIILVTFNTSDFAQFSGLRVADWSR
jgi:tRNA(fMet)-specific endonuclease VapC